MDHERMRRLHGGKGEGPDMVSHRIALLSKDLIARDTWLFRFEKPKGFTYRAGQHVRMRLLNRRLKDPAGNFRFWSFASAPFDPDLAFAVRTRNSPFKIELANLPFGGEVQIDMLKDAPHQAFALDDASTPVVFITGGIGVAPAYSMARQALNDGSDRSLTLLYANRSLQDAPFLDELAALATQHDNFHFAPTLTQDAPATWPGERGRISLAMVQRHVPAFAEGQYYISGLKGMVEDLNAALLKAGVPATAIRTEAFGTFTTAPAVRRLWSTLVPPAALVVLVAAVVAAHVIPAWLVVNRLPVDWLKTHAIPVWIASAVLVILAVKVGLYLLLRRDKPHPVP